MSWIEELIDLYDKNSDLVGKMQYKPIRTKNGTEQVSYVLLPPFHTTVTAQITVTIDEEGNFLAADSVENDDKLTIIPVTEKSGSRTAGKEPHPLCDNLKYLAGDYSNYCRDVGKDAVCYQLYIRALENWHISSYSNKKVDAIYYYLVKKTLIQDLIRANVLKIDENGFLSEEEKIQGISQNKAFVRFRIRRELTEMDDLIHVNAKGENPEECWKDQELQQCFIQYCHSMVEEKGLCYLTGEQEQISYLHSKKIRNEGDGSKLISSNDGENFTFRGRFLTKEEAFSIGSETSQKAHNALKWIIRKQGYSYDTLTMVTWESNMQPMPRWDLDTEGISEDYDEGLWDGVELPIVSDGNQLGAGRFYAALEGYRRNLLFTSRMILMGLDAATTGRLAVVEYKTLESSRYLNNIEKWHRDCEWVHGKKKKGVQYRFFGMIGVRDIADILYGTETKEGLTIVDKNGKKLYAEVSRRLIPCIWDHHNLPFDLMTRVVSKASNPLAYKERFNWERVLSLACSFIKKHRKERYSEEEWTVALDTKCKDRNYLYGRLLAVADRVEYRTFDKENSIDRVTNAKRYMSTFSQRPFETWKVIEENLQPYINKLKKSERRYYENLIDEICQLFEISSFTNTRLDALYLLGFHSQSHDLRSYKNNEDTQGGN